jgi:DNA-binding response OmpR family regulator/HPt (histidine-containing phosphotransfer) domain-containing protein
MKILVVEDDLLVADALIGMLSRHNYAVEIAHDGQAGLDCIEAFNYDLLLLDVVLPKLDGISLCRHVRSRGYLMPILLLTSKDSKHDRAVGLDAGADDYVVKPFDPEELSARIRALLRRGNDNSQPILTWKGLSLDPRNCEVTYQHQILTLTPKEYALLELFLRHSQRLFSCGSILEHLWSYEETPSEEAVRTHIKGLRHKLKAVGAPHDLVETVYGIGYRLKSSHSPATMESVEVAPDRHNDVVVARSSPPNSGEVAQSDTPQLLTAIWDRYYDQTIDRVEIVDRAIAALKAGSLSTETRLQACQSAHALAGALGTFGLPLGSQAAKQIELLLDANLDLTPAQIPQLQSGLEDLRREIASKGKVAEVETKIAAPDRDRLSFRAANAKSAEATPTTTYRQERGYANSPSPPTTQLLIVTKDPALAPAVQADTTGNFEIVSATELTSTQLVTTPDLIILDLDCFPQDTDGLAVLADLERDYPIIPVLVLSQPTSHADIVAKSVDPTRQLHHRIEVARRGGRMFLSKPISARQISLAVDRVLQQAQVHQASILIVDDDLLLLAGMTALLSSAGMTVTTLSEPNRFWETLEACNPDLLILDLDMPIYNGIELCRAVRTDPCWTTLPIMFLTAHAAALAIDRVFAAGADDFIPKPALASALVTRIVNRLERIGLHQSVKTSKTWL